MSDAETGDQSDTIQVDWRFFADIADAAGGTRRTVSLQRDATIRAALRAAIEIDEAIADVTLDDDGNLRDHLTVLQNGRRVENLGTSVEAGDELAIMPPVSGG